jgi:hypothetical protein
MKTYTFEAKLLKDEQMDAAYITFPYNVEKEFGTKGQVKVKAVFDEKAEYRGSLVNMGLAQHCLGVTQHIRKLIGKAPGDVVCVSLFVDNEARVMDIPADLQEGIHTRGLNEAFQKLSYSKQRKIVDSILNAKKAETRARRIEEALDTL